MRNPRGPARPGDLRCSGGIITPNPSPQPRIFQPPTNGEHFHVDGRNYWIGEMLGQGAFGAVYACKDEWGNELVAKVLLPRDRSYEEIQQHCLRERERLLELRHPNITFLRECCEYRDTFYLILERCSFTLTQIITLPDLVPDLWIPWVARDVLQGLDYIHSKDTCTRTFIQKTSLLRWPKIRCFRQLRRSGRSKSPT